MNQDTELSTLMQLVAEKSLRMLENFKTQPNRIPFLIQQYIDLCQDFQILLGGLLKNPEQTWQMQLAYWQDALSLAKEQFSYWLEGKPMPIADRRFSADEWVNNPFFNLLSQQYLLASEHFSSLLDHIDFGDKQLGRRIRFFTRQYLDAISPANFIQTNPQLMAETIQSHGKNLLRGLENLLTDIDAGSSGLLIRMTDLSAFKLGKNIATTPGKVVFRNSLMELIQYSPKTEDVYKVPLLIIPPWINKYYILDLSKENSLVGYLIKQGITVFIISWINPDVSHAKKGLSEYMLEGPLTALEVIQHQLSVKKINCLGFCIGGTLMACMLAYLKKKSKNIVNSATFLASMIDFSDPGDIAVFIDENQILQLEEQMNKKGFLEGRFMSSTFNSLRANDLIWSFFVKNYLQGKDPLPFDILYWNADATNMPAKMHSEYLRWMYLHNYLAKPGKIILDSVSLDVHQIDTPSFFVSTIKDHIAPWETTYLGFKMFKGEKQFLLGGSGHIAGIINPPEAKKYEYYINQAAPASPKTWLAKALKKDGSWWPEWLKWLKKHSGKKVAAPKIKEQPFKPLMKAPGSYVLKNHIE